MTSGQLTAATSAPATRTAARSFYTGMAVAFLLTVLLGFASSARLREASGSTPLEPRVVAHGALFGSWFLLFLLQTMLAASGRVALHKRLGYLGAAIAAAITVNGPSTAVAAARRGALGQDGLAFMLVMIGDVLGFAGFAAAAMCYRHRTETHKRLMLLGTTSLVPPAVFRWPFVAGSQAAVGAVMVAFLAAGPVNDLLSRRRVHPASLWGGIALLLSVPLRFAISQSVAWHRLASWLIR